MTEQPPPWPTATGELADRIRRHDWSATSLGPIEDWDPALRTLVQLMLDSPQPVLIGWGRDGQLLYNDIYAATILGAKHPDALGRRFADVWPELVEATSPFFANIAEASAQRFEDYRVELPHRPDAPTGWFDFSWTPVRNSAGAIAGFYCSAVETTAKVRAAEARQESEERFRLLVESWAQAVWETPPDGHPTDDSPTWRRSTGQSVEELIGTGWLDAVHPGDRADVAARWQTSVDSGALFDIEFRVRRASGGWQWANVRAAPLRDDEGRIRKWVGMNVDVTDRRAAEDEARANLAQLNLIADGLPAMIGYIDADTRYVWVNAELERFLGRPRASLIGRTMRASMAPADYLRIQPHIHAVLRGERVQFEDCLHDRFGPGRHFWSEESFVPDHGPEGQVRGFFKLGIDVTARKQAEADLRQSEEHYRLAIGAFQGGVAGFDPATGEVWGTEGYARLLGEAPERWRPTRDGFFARIHPDDLARVRDTLGRLATGTPGPLDLEYRLRHSDGGWRMHWTRATPLSGSAPPHEILAATIDITERHEWQAKLATEGERLRLALDVGRLATWDWDMRQGTVAWNTHHYLLQGYRPGEVEPSYAAWAARVHPDDLPGVEAAVEAAREERRDFMFEYRQTLPRGEIRWCAARGRFFYDEAGAAVRMIGMMEDVTEARAAQEALAASERELRSLVSALPQTVFRSRGDGARRWVSSQWSAYTGLPEERSLDLDWLEAVHPDDRAATLAAWKEAAATREYAVDHRIREGRTGAWRWHQTRAIPIDAPEGSGDDWVGTSTDIDEVRRLQGRQQTLLAELQHRVRNSLGIIRSIVRRTAETSESVDTMAAHLVGRIEAFARVQAAVTRDPVGGVDLAGLIEDELLAYATREGPRLHLKGPAVLLGARAAESMSLAIHELTTNAVKHGVLSSRQGWIDVDWSIEGDRFLFSWKEAGGETALSEPAASGFGLELLLRSLPYDLGAETKVAFDPSGLRFTLSAATRMMLHPPHLAA